MPNAYFKRLFTPPVLSAQHRLGSYQEYARKAEDDRNRAQLTELEIQFIEQSDSFFLATVTSDGLPYIQYKGGTPGFVSVHEGNSLWFADYRGNRQYITLGNLARNENASLFFIDFESQKRLKVLAQMKEQHGAPDGFKVHAEPGTDPTSQRFLVATVQVFDWNCPNHIVRRIPAERAEADIAQRDARIVSLEAEIAAFRGASTGPAGRASHRR